MIRIGQRVVRSLPFLVSPTASAGTVDIKLERRARSQWQIRREVGLSIGIAMVMELLGSRPYTEELEGICLFVETPRPFDPAIDLSPDTDEAY